uniref:RNase H family protein n=1 Tax=Solanum tuberosum TaxID=4113 RepID=M0ZK97_SOLTU
MNSDGSCVGNSCGGGGVIRDSLGRFIMAFILPLGQGTSNLAEASSFLFGLKWCVDNGHTFILGETDSLLLQNCINDSWKVPRRKHEEVQEIKKLVIDHEVITRHCFREANKVADKLASMSHNTDAIKVYTQYRDLPTTIRGLLTTD